MLCHLCSHNVGFDMIIQASVQLDKKNVTRVLLQHITKLSDRASATQIMFALFHLYCNAQISEYASKQV